MSIKDVFIPFITPAEQKSVRVNADRDRVLANQRAAAAISVRRNLAKPRS